MGTVPDGDRSARPLLVVGIDRDRRPMLIATFMLVAACLVLGLVASSLVGTQRGHEPGEPAAAVGLPPSLHPEVDLEVCVGSLGCVDACPERALTFSAGAPTLSSPGDCVGHGRCREACPVGAIRLVIGTAERGVDLPMLRAGFETNVEGVFVAGELGGMGLIRNAMRQGTGAAAAAERALARPHARPAPPGAVDVAIVGAGPAGIAAALACVERGLRYALLEQGTVGGSIASYPRRKLVLSERVRLPVVGPFGRREMRKEELIAELARVIEAAGLEVREGRRVTGLAGALGAFRLEVAGPGGEGPLDARAVVLAIGRRGTPRRLGVPGEELSHVVYRLVDPEQYRGRRVLCVGGGDSALEAAVALSEVARTEVHLAYRGAGFGRAKGKNVRALEAAAAAGRLTLHLGCELVEVRPEAALLAAAGAEVTALPVDDVIVCAGGELPTPFLRAIGVEVVTKRGEELAP